MAYQDDDELNEQVIQLTRFRGTGVRPVISKIEAYWDSVRGRRLVPARADVDPKGLQGNLSNVFILERIASGLARFRISGSHLTDLMGLEVRGMPLSAVFTPDARENLSRALEAVFDEPAVVRLELSSPSGFGQKEMIGEMILLPLRSDLGEVSRVLGAVSMAGDIGRSPRRLTITDQSHRSLTGYAGDVGAPLRGFSELDNRPPSQPSKSTTNVPAKPAALTKDLPPYLKLVTDNTPEQF